MRWSLKEPPLPTVYFNRIFVEAGGLISYGPNFIDNYRRAAGYVDRILKGERPADLPVQTQTKYELANQSQNRQGNGPHNSFVGAHPRRRGDRIRKPMSAFGSKQTWARAPHTSAFGGKADMAFCTANVCF